MANNNTVYVAPKAAALANPTSASPFVKSSDSTKACAVYLPGANKFDSKLFRIRACGTVTGGTTTNVTITLYKGTDTTLSNDTKIADSGAIAVNSTSGVWALSYEGLTDSTTKKLAGKFNGFINGTAKTDAIHSALADVDPSVEGNGFVIGALFSATDTGNKITLTDFAIEAL